MSPRMLPRMIDWWDLLIASAVLLGMSELAYFRRQRWKQAVLYWSAAAILLVATVMAVVRWNGVM